MKEQLTLLKAYCENAETLYWSLRITCGEYVIPHPGIVLGSMLKEREIKQCDFATAVGLKTPNLNAVVKGKRIMSEKLARSLETRFNKPASFWLKLQALYDFRMRFEQIDKMEKNL